MGKEFLQFMQDDKEYQGREAGEIEGACVHIIKKMTTNFYLKVHLIERCRSIK